jgi:hypothetical protein
MAKRFLAVFGLPLLYMAMLGVVLFALITTLGDDEGLMLIGILNMLVLLIVALVPYLNWVIRRAFAFRGEGALVARDELLMNSILRSGWDVRFGMW